MSGLLPAAVYGLEVPPGDVMIPAVPDFPASFRISMAAIDPTADPEYEGNIEHGSKPRATLKLIRQPFLPSDSEDEDDSDSDSEADRLDAILNGADSDEDDDEDSEEEGANGGPSDPAKSKKARQEAAKAALKQALEEGGVDSAALDKGKAKATDLDSVSDSDSDDEDLDFEEFVICTLDPDSHYQQTIDITIQEEEHVFFKVTGTHSIFLTGNYVIPVDDTAPRDPYLDEDEEYDLSPDEDELMDEDMLEDDDEESDELDDIDDPRITELDDEEVPKLVRKGQNKRAAESDSDEEGATLDGIISKALKPEVNGEKLSKKEKKKLKNNAGAAVVTAKVETDSPSGKKVSFAKNLEQGPTGSQITTEKKVNGATVEKTTAKADAPKADNKPKPSATGVKTVKGVTIDVRKPGSGPAAKKGSRVSMRYIGKLKDGKQFDANSKGKPFTFKLGAGEVIQGWEIGMEGICAGGERRLTIPANLAYGNKSLPGIPKGSELRFDVKCLEVN